MADDVKRANVSVEIGQADTHQFRRFLIKSYVQPVYSRDVSDIMRWKNLWHQIRNWSLGFMTLFMVASSLLAFYAMDHQDEWLYSFLAGSCGMGALLCWVYSVYADRERNEHIVASNRILEMLKINDVPEINAPDEEEGQEMKQV